MVPVFCRGARRRHAGRLGVAAAGGGAGTRAARWTSAPAPLHRHLAPRLALPRRLFKKEPTTKEVARSTQRDIAHNVRDLERCVPPPPPPPLLQPTVATCLPAFLPSLQCQPPPAWLTIGVCLTRLLHLRACREVASLRRDEQKLIKASQGHRCTAAATAAAAAAATAQLTPAGWGACPGVGVGTATLRCSMAGNCGMCLPSRPPPPTPRPHPAPCLCAGDQGCRQTGQHRGHTHPGAAAGAAAGPDHKNAHRSGAAAGGQHLRHGELADGYSLGGGWRMSWWWQRRWRWLRRAGVGGSALHLGGRCGAALLLVVLVRQRALVLLLRD